MFKKIFAVAILGVLACNFNNVAFAQGSVSESDDEIVQVTAHVDVPLRVTRLSELDLGSVRRGQSKVVSATESGAAEVVVIGDAGEDIHLTYPMGASGVTLSHTDDDDGATLQVILSCRSGYTRTGTMSSYVSGTGAELSEDGSGDGTMDGDGQRYFRFGGSVTASNNQARGDYNGSFMVTADYHP